MAFIASGGGAGQEWKVSPNADNSIDLLEKMRAFADDTNDSVQTIGAVVSGGSSGYAVGDLLELDDGAASEAFPTTLSGCRATFEVTGETAGVVDTVRLRQSGCYSTLPTDNGTSDEFNTTILTGSGVGVVTIGTVAFSGNGWTEDRISEEVASVAINAGGTGYGIGDTISLIGGDTRVGFTAPQTDTPAVFTVLTLSGSAIATMTLTTPGVYHRNPGTTGISVNTLTGSGSGATVDVTYAEFGDDTTGREMIMSSGDLHIGIRTFTDGGNVHSFELMGMQAYVSGNDWDAQTNRSPGRYPDADGGSFVILENEEFSYYISITDRRIVAVFNIDVGIYSNMYLGAIDQVNTAAQYPQPLAVIGCSSGKTIHQGSQANRWLGMNLCSSTKPVVSGDVYGPGAILTPGASWIIVRNGESLVSGASITATNLTTYDFANFIPGGEFRPADGEFDTANEFVAGGDNDDRWSFWCLAHKAAATNPGMSNNANDNRFITMGNEGGDEFPVLWEITAMNSVGSARQLFGELSGVRQVDRRLDVGFLSSEDDIDDGSKYYYVFNNCNTNDSFAYFAVEGA